MTRELSQRSPMQTAQQRPDYVGALLEEERRLVLASVDPNEPWEAFRRLRRAMRKEPRGGRARIDIFNAPAPLEHTADIIPLASRRRAG
ncbi:MAG TPA: hypothetical protein VGB52_04285 [Actinomycetota bacterium]